MKITFWHSDKPRERVLADAFCIGARRHGETVELRPLLPDPEVANCDVACMVGVKSRELFRLHWQAGIHTVYLDKGYSRQAAAGPVKLWEYWRVAVDGHQPTAYLPRMQAPPDRLDALGVVELPPWRVPDPMGTVLFAGSSQKYHEFYGLSHPTRFAQKVFAAVRAASGRQIIYRPKPSWRDAVPIEGSTYSTGAETIEQALRSAHCLVTHGSNACWEALLAGVPAVVLGPGITAPISSTDLAEIENPRRASDAERRQLLADLAYCQWTLPEFAEGEAWPHIRRWVFR